MTQVQAQRIIAEMVERIVKRFDPERVILYEEQKDLVGTMGRVLTREGKILYDKRA